MLNKFINFSLEKGKIWLLISLLLPFIFSIPQAQADKKMAYVPTQEMVIEAAPMDPRAVVLRDYFAKYNSPLEDHASDFVAAADKYNLDWRLVAAISGVESTFGKQIPGGYNGWGWGVYGNQALYFNSWTDGIYTVSKGLKENYYDKGLTDPYSINVVYAASPTWGAHVTYFLNDIDKFSKNYPLVQNDNLSKAKSIEPTVAMSSAALTSVNKPMATPTPVIALGN